MRPGAAPRTHAQAREMIDEMHARILAALDPYLWRAKDAQLAVDDQLVDERDQTLAEVTGADLERSMMGSAVIEILTDLLHFCGENDISYNRAITQALDSHGTQLRAAAKYLMYNAPDDEGEEDGGDVWLSR